MAVVVWKNIGVLRGLAMCFVVLIHSVRYVQSNFIAPSGTFSPATHPAEFTVIISICAIAPLCLLAFVFASGFTMYQMYLSWRATWRTAFTTLKKYLIWSIFLFLLLSIKDAKFDLEAIIKGIFFGGPMSGYWFIVFIIIMYLISPLWIFLVRLYPISSTIIAITLQVFSFWLYYSNYVFPEALTRLVILPLIFSPTFIAGLFLCKYSKECIPYLQRNKKSFKKMSCIFSILCIAEATIIGYFNDWDASSVGQWIATERITVLLLFIT